MGRVSINGCRPGHGEPSRPGEPPDATTREADWHVTIFINTDRSRFTGASIAGLVVGAMGVFVFAVALRHWLKERRKLREGARA